MHVSCSFGRWFMVLGVLGVAVPTGLRTLFFVNATAQSVRPVEVNVTNDLQHRYATGRLAVHPKNANHLVLAAARTSYVSACAAGDPRCAIVPIHPETPGGTLLPRGFQTEPEFLSFDVFVSMDGGRTWKKARKPPVSPRGFERSFLAAHPSVVAAPDGTFYLSWINNVFMRDVPTSVGGVPVSKSTDGGFTWSAPVYSGMGIDHPLLVVDSSTGDLYMAATGTLGPGSTGDPKAPPRSPRQHHLIRSRDGVKWTSPQPFPGSASTFQNFMSAAYGVLATGMKITSATVTNEWGQEFPLPDLCAPRPRPCHVFQTTTDAGATWSRHPFAVPPDSGPPLVSADPTRRRHFTVAVLNGAGTQFLVYQTHDSGNTWSGPTAVTADVQKPHYAPWMAYSPDGVLGFAWRVREAGAGKTFPYTVWATISRNGGSSFSSPLQVSSATSPPEDPINLPRNQVSFVAMSRQNAFVSWGDFRPGEMQTFVSAINLQAFTSRVSAQSAAALTGVVTSAAEGNMEGVVVTARADGADFDVSVVSDARGRYSFPGTHLKPGAYALKIRAVGYELGAPARASVAAGKAATVDLRLRRAADMTQGQLTSLEWAMNLPGTDGQKDMVLKQTVSCAYCHSIERIVRSKHTADEFLNVITRMHRYYGDGTVYGFEGRGRAALLTAAEQDANEKNPVWGFYPPIKKTDIAAYLATITMGGGVKLPTQFRTLPRPKGVETKVIVTQWDMPRKDTVAHDADIDAQGNLWYTDQTALFIGRFDAKAGTFKEWPVAGRAMKPSGTSDIVVDKDGNVWFPVTSDAIDRTFGLVTKFDPKTETFTPVKNVPRTAVHQFMGLDANGNLWTGAIGMRGWTRINTKTATAEEVVDWWNVSKDQPAGQLLGYQMEVDSKGNPVTTLFNAGYILKYDSAARQVKFIKVPTPGGIPRRGRMDTQDRFWFSIYAGDKIGMLDMRTDTIKEYAMPLKYFTPYSASYPDRLGRVYAGSNTADRLARLDTKTGKVIMYLMPTRDFDTKKISIDPGDGKTVWFANMRSARVVRVEPLD